jgi:hypothetical protein
MEIDEFTRTFFQMEMEEEFFSTRTPNGDPFWDVVRYEVFFSLLNEINVPKKRHKVARNRPRLSWLARIIGAPMKILSMASQWARLKRIQPADFVAYICSRYKDVGGKPIDLASDDALHALSEFGSILRVESSHFSLLQDVNFSTLISFVARIYRVPASYEQFFRDVVAVIADAERKYLGMTDPHLFNVLRGTYRSHLVERRVWREILDRSQSRLVFMTQNGIQKGLILEARKRNVPVVEFQHGNITTMHTGYSYPPNLPQGDGVLLPDVLLLFSEHWKRQCCMPGTKLVVVGNNRFSCAGASSTRTGAAVFVSAGPFHKYLSPLAMELAQSMPDRAFIMKLHPSYLSNRAMIEKGFAWIPNLTVVGAEKSIPELMEDASDMIVGQSTAAYEALDRGVPVHIPRIDGYTWHKDLFALPDVHLFSTAEELQSTLFKPVNRWEGIPQFFGAFDPVVFRELVRCLDREPHASI